MANIQKITTDSKMKIGTRRPPTGASAKGGAAALLDLLEQPAVTKMLEEGAGSGEDGVQWVMEKIRQGALTADGVGADRQQQQLLGKSLLAIHKENARAKRMQERTEPIERPRERYSQPPCLVSCLKVRVW